MGHIFDKDGVRVDTTLFPGKYEEEGSLFSSPSLYQIGSKLFSQEWLQDPNFLT
jgi:hypothetical protein